MPFYPIATAGTAGDPIYLDATGKLPAVDGSQLTGVTSSPSISQVTVDFGFPTGPIEGDKAVFTVSSGGVQSTSRFVCTVQGGTADHDTDDAAVEGIVAYVTNIVPTVSFDIVAYAPQGTWGRYFVNYVMVA